MDTVKEKSPASFGDATGRMGDKLNACDLNYSINFGYPKPFANCRKSVSPLYNNRTYCQSLAEIGGDQCLIP